MTIRKYESADFDTIQGWAKAHGMALVPQLLSPNGFVVEDDVGLLAACWVYLTFDCPRASIDDFYTRPGADVWRIKEAWNGLNRVILDFFAKLRDNNGPVRYSVLITFANAELSKFLESDGWQVSKKPHYLIMKAITYDS